MSTLREQWLSHLAANAPETTSSGNGSCYLSELAVIAFTGTDAPAFLQGYLTCDTTSLTAERLQPWALCNLQGRVVANGWCKAGNDDDVELILHRSLTPALADFFKPYLLFSQAELSTRTEDALVFGSLNGAKPGSLAVGKGERLSIVADFSSALAIYDATASPNAWYASLFASGTCLLNKDTSAAFLPQMLGLAEIGAVSFDKGCYLGQEVVARAQHRGSVKRRLQQLSWQGSEPAAGASLLAENGAKAGTVINAVATQADTGIALAVINNAVSYPLQLAETPDEPHQNTLFTAAD
jgi:folate-binding protein YgfZ